MTTETLTDILDLRESRWGPLDEHDERALPIFVKLAEVLRREYETEEPFVLREECTRGFGPHLGVCWEGGPFDWAVLLASGIDPFDNEMPEMWNDSDDFSYDRGCSPELREVLNDLANAAMFAEPITGYWLGAGS
jgi:hypothetical protein